MKHIAPSVFWSKFKWIDGRPLPEIIEPYRAKIFDAALYSFDDNGRPTRNLVLAGRAKKNWKSADLIFAALYRLLGWKSQGGNQCYILADDLDQSDDDLELAKKTIAINLALEEFVQVKQS